jgi:hypothetical protein
MLVPMLISRRQLLVGGGLGLAVAGGIYAVLRDPSGPVLNPLPVGRHPDGYLVAAYQPNPRSWRVFDPRSGNYVARNGSFVACSPDLHYTLTYDPNYDALDLPLSSKILDTATGAVEHSFGRAWNMPLGWSRDGRHIVVGSTVFHDVNSKEDNYITLDRVRIFDAATGGSRAVAHWKSVRLSRDWSAWWTTDGRLVHGDRLIAMDGSLTVAHNADIGSPPVLGTDRVISITYDGDGRTGSFVTGQHTADLIAGTAWQAAPRQIDAKWVGIDDSGLQWLAWLDNDRIIGLRDHDLAAYNVRDHTRQVFMTFPDDVVEGVLIAPAVGVPATIR